MDKENRLETAINNTSFIRRIAWMNIAFQSLFPVIVSFSPAMAANTGEQIENESVTVPAIQRYIVQKNETLNDIAKKFNVAIDEIKAANPQLSLFNDNTLLTSGKHIVIPARKKWLKLPDTQQETAKQETTKQEPTGQENQLAHAVKQTGQFLTNDPNIHTATDLVRSSLVSKANGEIEQWLKKMGNARVQLNVDKKFSLSGSQFDLLFPLWEQKENLIFNQSSLHKTDGRTQVNLGLGWRHFTPEYMYGNNVFFDHDLSRSHSRIGLGVEYWRDYLKLSANGYLKISNWKDTPDIEDYRARPANGWDIRAEGYFKYYPQLGAKLMYEKYYGNEVALFGNDKRQNNPQALTAGITYTPVPLITFGVERKQGNSGQNDTNLNLQINYQFGMPWSKQISTDAVPQLRTLANNRYSFVERNNNIILDYQKKEVIRLQLDKEINGYAGEEKPLKVSVTSKYGLERIDWNFASLMKNGGNVIEKEHHDYHILLPHYQYGKNAKNTYQISAVAIDKKGNRSSRVSLQVIVSSAAIDKAHSLFLPEKIVMPTDGKSTRQVILEIRDRNNLPVDVDVQELNLQVEPEHRTQDRRSTGQSSGKNETASSAANQSIQISAFQRIGVAKYALKVTAGTRPERLKLTPFSRNVAFSFAHVVTKANEKTAQIKPDQLKVLTKNVPADGASPHQIALMVVDEFGNPIPDYTVKSTADHGAVMAQEGQTDANGQLTVSLTNTQAGVTTVTLDVGGREYPVKVAFMPDEKTAQIKLDQLKVLTENVPADNVSPHQIALTVVDGFDNPIPDYTVKSIADHGAKMAQEGQTDANGQLTVSLTNAQAGVTTVTLDVGGQEYPVKVTFMPNEKTAQIKPDQLKVLTENVPADGVSPHQIALKVVDGFDNPIPDYTVKSTADHGAEMAQEGQTDANGQLTVSLTNTQAGVTTVTLDVGGQEYPVGVTFIPDEKTAQIHLGQQKVLTKNVPADDVSPHQIALTVADKSGNPIPNYTVKSTADHGAKMAQEGQTDANGQLTVSLTNAQAGVTTVTQEVGGQEYPVGVTFMPDEKTAQIKPDQLKVLTENVPADGVSPHQIALTVVDEFGNRIPGYTVKSTADHGAAMAQEGQTDANGQLTVSLTNIQAGVTTVTLEVGGQEYPVKVTFVPDEKTAQIKLDQLKVLTENVPADGVSPHQIALTVVDEFGNSIPGYTVKSTADHGAIMAQEGQTDANGQLTVSLTNTQAGVTTVTLDVGGREYPVKVTFMPDEKTAQIKLDQLKVLTENVPADNVSPHQIALMVVDEFGNPIPGYTVKSTADHGAAMAQEGQTDANGQLTVSLTNTQAGVTTVTLDVGGRKYPVKVTFMPDEKTAQIKLDQLKVLTENVPADNVSPHQIALTVVDGFDNPIPDYTVKSIADHGAKMAQEGQTDANGQLTVSLTNTQAGVTTVTLDVGGREYPVKVTFMPDEKTAQIKLDQLKVLTKDVPADGVSPHQIALMVVDEFGNPIPGYTVKSTADHGGVMAQEGQTGANGQLTVSLTNTQAGVTTVTLEVGGQEYPVEVTFVPDEKTAQIAEGNLQVIHPDGSIAKKDDKFIADGETKYRVRAIVTDKSGNLLPDAEVTFQADNQAKITSETLKTDKAGKVEGSISSTKSGATMVTATINRSTGTVQSELSMLFIGNNMTANVVKVELDASKNKPDSAGKYIADGQTPVTLKALVVDKHGNALPSITVSWASDRDKNSVAFGNAQSETDENGAAVTTITSKKAFDVKVTAIAKKGSKISSNTSEPIQFKADLSTGKLSAITPSKSEALIADDKDSVELVSQLLDGHGNPLKGEKVVWSVDKSRAVINQTSTTDENGYARTILRTTQAGAIAVTANYGDSNNDQSITINAQADLKTAKVVLTSEKNVAVADGQELIKIIATVVDANNNPLVGRNITWNSPGSNPLTPFEGLIDAQGKSSTEISSTRAGEKVIEARLTDKIKATHTVTFTAISPDSAQADAEGMKAQGSFTLSPQSIVANGATKSEATLILKDQHGNLIPGQNDKIKYSVVSGDAGSITFHNQKESAIGTYNVTIPSGTKEGTVVIRAKITEQLYFDTTLKLLADEATKQLADVTMMKGIKAVTPKSGLRLKRSPITVNADGQDSVVIQAQLQDNNGNKSLPGINVSWKTSLGELSSISSQTDANGIAEVTLTSTQTGDAQVTAILATKEKTAPTQAHFMAGALSAAHSLVTISKNVAVAGEDVQITFTPKDRYGNTLTEPVENLTLAFTNNLGIRSGSPVFKPNNAGSYIATIQGTKAGQTDITVNVDSLRIDQSVKLEIVANRAKPQATDETNPFTLSKKGVDGVLKGSDSVTVGETVIYSISLTDENGNPLDKDIQTDWFIEGKGSLNATRVLTDNNGIARVELSSKETGTAKVTVNLPGGKSYTQNTVFTPGKLNTAMSEVTLSKSSIIADGKDTTTLTAKLYDTLKNAIPNQSTRINVTAPEASGVNISSQVIENKARPGEYTISINGTKSGEVKFTVFVDSAELLNKPVLKLIGDSRTKKMTAFTVSQNPVQAGNSVTYSLKVIDANNNPLEDIMVSWRLPSNMVDDNTPKPKSTSQTNELGIAEINLTPLKIGKFTLEASLDGQKYEKMPELTVTPSSVDRQKSTFTTNLEKIEAGDELQEAILTVTLLDKYDNPISGQQVNVGLVNKLGGVKVGAVKDHGDGTYTAPVTLGSHSGIAEFHATADEQKIGDTLSIKVEKMIPKLNFSHKKVRATYTKNYPQSQKVLNSPAGARQIWSSSAPDVAKVDSQGNVTLLKAGNTTITVETESTEQYKMASASYQLNVKRANPLLKSQNAQISAEWNDGITYSVIPEIGNPDANNDDFLEMAQFSSSDNNVVKVDKNGKLQAVKPGTATIMIKTPRTEQFRKSTATVRYQLKKGKVKIEFGRNIIRGSIHDEDIKLLQQNPSSPIPPDVKLKTKSSAHSVISISDDSSMSNNWQVKSVGTTTITQYISGNDYYNDSKGSYKVDIYGVPEIVAPSIKVTNAGEESGNKDWIPVFEDDVISVSWSLGKHTNDYDKAALVTVQLIEEGGRLLDEDKYIVSRLRPSGLMKTSFYPEKSYWGKKAFIRFRVDGFASTVNQTEMSSFYIKNLKPHEIWKSFGVQTHIIKEHEPGKGYTGRLGFAKGPIKSLRYLLKQNKMIFGSSRKLISPMDISIEAVSITDVLSFRSDNTKKFTIQGDRTDDFENNEANRWDLNYSNNQWPTGGRGSRGYELSVEIKYNDHVYKYRGTKQHVYNSGTAGMTTQFTDDKWELIQ